MSSTENTEYLQNNIFTATNFLYFIWILGIYFIIYFMFSPNTDIMGRIINIILLTWIIYLCSYLFFEMTEEQKSIFWKTSVNWMETYFNNDNEFLWIILYTIIFYVFIYVLNISLVSDQKPFMVTVIESGLWIIIFLFIVIFFFKYILKINIVDLFFEWFNNLTNNIIIPEKKYISTNTNATTTTLSNEIINLSGEEVFNISNNLYSYTDADAICKTYGARLANYNDIEKAYNNGAEWCSYGWSENQMAYFPTQKATWENLQKHPKHKNDCGRPGVNGGYIGNPEFKFGVNCYGKKPKPKQGELDLMNTKRQYIVPKSEEDILMDKKIKYWTDNSANLLKINSYNGEKWSKY